ncbi:MAG TPA: hypothetical protein VKT74_06945 [Gammaproteobacteria bacterium]|nr:hypothetical protein [Gammaproteobacteria bacterium]
MALAGCAAQRGEILGADPLGYTDTAFISVPEDEYFWISPPPAGRHDVQPAEVQILKDGLWVREGWFQVEFQCYSPRDATATTDHPILPETPDEKAVYIHGGHRYRLSCSATRVGVFDIDEQDAPPDQ